MFCWKSNSHLKDFIKINIFLREQEQSDEIMEIRFFVSFSYLPEQTDEKMEIIFFVSFSFLPNLT
jgi:hypothetical protein